MPILIKDYPIIYNYTKSGKINLWKLQIVRYGSEYPCMKGIYIEYFSTTKKDVTSKEIYLCTHGRSVLEQAKHEANKIYENRLKKTKNIITDVNVINQIETDLKNA